jgi:hypothetical protein
VFKSLFRILLTLVCVVALLWLFAPRILDSAANAQIGSPGSPIQGMVQYVPAGVDSPNINQGDLQINLSGLTPATSYHLTLDQAQCGGSSTQLRDVQSDTNGNLYAEIPLGSIDLKQNWYLNVLQQGQSVACGLLQTNRALDTQVVNSSITPPAIFGPPDTPDAQATQDANQGSTSLTNTTSAQDDTNKPLKTGLPNTGVAPGNSQQYDNIQFPRKY